MYLTVGTSLYTGIDFIAQKDCSDCTIYVAVLNRSILGPVYCTLLYSCDCVHGRWVHPGALDWVCCKHCCFLCQTVLVLSKTVKLHNHSHCHNVTLPTVYSFLPPSFKAVFLGQHWPSVSAIQVIRAETC